MAIFTAEQKKFIVKVFGRNPSLSSVRREFLFYFKITERLHARLFSIVNSRFVQNESVLQKKRTTGFEPLKGTPKKIEQDQIFVS